MSVDSKNSPIEPVFELLDRWRHLPAYRLEPRADIFFALYLPEVLGNYFETEINPLLVPEFPIKKAGNSASFKADYLALERAKGGSPAKRAFLVELKTDIASRREEQDEYLREAVKQGLKELVKGVIDICLDTPMKSKYLHLLKLLSDLGLVEYEDDLYPARRGYSEALRRVSAKLEKDKDRKWPSLEVVYVQPTTNTIDFNEFADAVEAGPIDGIRQTFAHYLRRWAAEKAGSPRPKDWSSP